MILIWWHHRSSLQAGLKKCISNISCDCVSKLLQHHTIKYASYRVELYDTIIALIPRYERFLTDIVELVEYLLMFECPLLYVQFAPNSIQNTNGSKLPIMLWTSVEHGWIVDWKSPPEIVTERLRYHNSTVEPFRSKGSDFGEKRLRSLVTARLLCCSLLSWNLYGKYDYWVIFEYKCQ